MSLQQTEHHGFASFLNCQPLCFRSFGSQVKWLPSIPLCACSPFVFIGHGGLDFAQTLCVIQSLSLSRSMGWDLNKITLCIVCGPDACGPLLWTLCLDITHFNRHGQGNTTNSLIGWQNMCESNIYKWEPWGSLESIARKKKLIIYAGRDTLSTIRL